MWFYYTIITTTLEFSPGENSVTKVDVSANTFFGARHAIATLYQLIWYDDEDDVLKILNTVTVLDCPKFAYV